MNTSSLSNCNNTGGGGSNSVGLIGLNSGLNTAGTTMTNFGN